MRPCWHACERATWTRLRPSSDATADACWARRAGFSATNPTVQEAFSSAFNSIAGFRGDASISTWLHRIVVNAALMQLRRRRRCSEMAIEDLSPRFCVDTRGPRAAVPPVGASEHWTAVRETREVVRHCIDQLPAHYRSVLLLRDIEELTTSEVAARLNLNPNTVKVRLHRARQTLKGLLDRKGLLAGVCA